MASATNRPMASSPFLFSPQASFGNDSSSRPKSPTTKGTVLENPFLKNPQQYSVGSGRAFNATTANPQRSPLMPLGTSRNFSSPEEPSMKPTKVSTPGPPPLNSLSRMPNMFLPMEIDPSVPKGQDKDKMKTPSPVKSPPYFYTDNKTTITPAASADNRPWSVNPIQPSMDDTWVVGYGYGSTSSQQYQELLDILLSCGEIEQHISGGNWLAVQYTSRYSAEKAIASQPIFSIKSNIYYGIDRLSQDRLRLLQQQQRKQSIEYETMTRTDQYRHNSGDLVVGSFPSTYKRLNESDILLLESSSSMKETKKITKQPQSICERLLAWYFDWEYDYHPKSD